jgi:hypothetical protein
MATHFILQLKFAVPSALPQWTCNGTSELAKVVATLKRGVHICFFFVIHSFELPGDVNIRGAAAPATTAATTAKPAGAFWRGVSSLFHFLVRWLVHAIFCNNVFRAPNNEADLHIRNDNVAELKN